MQSSPLFPFLLRTQRLIAPQFGLERDSPHEVAIGYHRDHAIEAGLGHAAELRETWVAGHDWNLLLAMVLITPPRSNPRPCSCAGQPWPVAPTRETRRA